MVDESKIYKAIKAILDDDATLTAILGVKDRDSKVIIGPEMPQYNPPMIQVVILTDEMDTVTTESEITFYVNAYSLAEAAGDIDFEEIENILQRCVDLIHDQDLAVTDHMIFEMFVEGRNAPVSDRNRSGVYFGGLRCRMFAIKTT